MMTNSRKAGTGVNVGDLARISEVISKMPGSTKGDTASPSGDAIIPLTDQTGSGTLIPNPDMVKLTIDDTVDPEVNPGGGDPGNTTRRSRRVQVQPKTPRTVACDPTLGSPPLESAPPWYPPHFYPPSFPSPYQYPYVIPSAHYLPQPNPRTASRPSASKQPTRFCSRVMETQQGYSENGRPVQPGEDRTEHNLLPDFKQARSENIERNEAQAGGADGGGSGDDDDDEDEEWSANSSKESEEKSYVAEEDTSDTDSSAPSESPTSTR